MVSNVRGGRGARTSRGLSIPDRQRLWNGIRLFEAGGRIRRQVNFYLAKTYGRRLRSQDIRCASGVCLNSWLGWRSEGKGVTAVWLCIKGRRLLGSQGSTRVWLELVTDIKLETCFVRVRGLLAVKLANSGRLGSWSKAHGNLALAVQW